MIVPIIHDEIHISNLITIIIRTFTHLHVALSIRSLCSQHKSWCHSSCNGFPCVKEVKVLNKTSHTCFAVYEVARCVHLHIFVHLWRFFSIIFLTWRLELRWIRETTFCSQNYCNLSLKPASNVLLLPGIDTLCKWIGCLILQTSEQQVHWQVAVIQRREM